MINKIFNIYFFLFIFAMINREFTPFGIDIRYVCILLSAILLFNSFKEKKKIVFDARTKLLTLFFGITFLSNIIWFFNSFTINISGFFVILISYIFNLISYFVFLLYADNIDINKYKKYLFISLIVLIISMSYCLFIGDLNQTFLSTYSGRVADISTNFFGGKYRISGFAQDPNYSSLFLMIGIISCIYFYKKEKKSSILFYLIPLIIFSCLSASKTVLAAGIIASIYYFVPKKILKKVNLVLIISVIVVPLLIIFFDIKILNNNISMTQRFKFWSYAKNLFFDSPIIGNGLTSFRSYFLANAKSGWYVQCHSTIFQILSETGIICLILFAKILYNNLNSKNKYISIITVVYVIFMVNTETLYHIYSIFIIAILPIIMERGNFIEKKCSSISS